MIKLNSDICASTTSNELELIEILAREPNNLEVAFRLFELLSKEERSIPPTVREPILKHQLASEPERHDLAAQLAELLMAQGRSVPPEVEKGALRHHLAEQPNRVDLAVRLSQLLAEQDHGDLDQAPTTEELIAQIESGSASREYVMRAAQIILASGKNVPLPIEAETLRYHVQDDPSRIDLKQRLVVVRRELGWPIDNALIQEVKGSYITSEYETDFQKLLQDYGQSVGLTDAEPEFHELAAKVRRFTMTTMERLYGLWLLVGYVAASDLEGDIVECGVWRGGSMMMAALELQRHNKLDRDLWLYDTYTGLPEPDEQLDIDVLGNRAIDGWRGRDLGDGNVYWAFASEEDVRCNMSLTGYPEGRLHFIKGMVEETIPGKMPEKIALLRIDTDWYSSYRHALNELYDRVVQGGVLVFDDYGHFQGARKAVDEFRRENGLISPLVRIDYSCRVMIKI